MTSKHFYTSADGLVMRSLQGAILLNPSLRLHSASRTVYTTGRSPNIQVGVISGGGAGHEPAHAGYTGSGMLSASVSGEIFTSPSSKQIFTTIRLAAFGDKSSSSPTVKRDILVIINNYTGDRLNFGLAIEKARLSFPSINIATVVVADDVSLLDSLTTQTVGPRGLAGNILVCKLLGALADTGVDLNQVKIYGDAVISNLASIGVALEHCHVPGRYVALESLGDDECEVGLGLHNEAGVNRMKIGSAQTVIQEMVKMILRSGDKASFLGGSDDECVLFMNNLGGLSQLEMGALLYDVVTELSIHNIHPRRIYQSSFMTSLNALGFSMSLLNVSGIIRFLPSKFDVDTYALLDSPTDAHSWAGVRKYWTTAAIDPSIVGDPMNAPEPTLLTRPSTLPHKLPFNIKGALRSACEAVLKAEKELTEYDTVTGDGDCGYTFAAGARAVLLEIQDPGSPLWTLDSAILVERIASILDDSMGGTIGALFGIYLNAYSGALQSASSTSDFNAAPLKAFEALSRHTTAKLGDRTVIDALYPFCRVLATSGDVNQAVDQSVIGAEGTRGMKPKLGRAVYIGRSVFDTPDPGAWGVARLLQGFVSGLSGKMNADS